MISVRVEASTYELTFPYSAAWVAEVKSLGGARWQAGRKCWVLPRTRLIAMALERKGWYRDEVMLTGGQDISTGIDERTFDGWKLTPEFKPMAHQVGFIDARGDKRRTLLRADMGTGKTLMAIMYLMHNQVHPDDVLIITKNSLVYNWEREWRAMLGDSAGALNVVDGTPAARGKKLAMPGAHVVNFEWIVQPESKEEKAAREARGVKKRRAAMIKREIIARGKKVLIIDESHLAKNPSAQRSKALGWWGESSSLTRVLLMTGTPIGKGIEDFFSQFRVLDHRLFGGSFVAFKNRYCMTERIRSTAFAEKIVGYKNVDEFMGMISPYVHDIKKAECMDLPEKVYQTIVVEMTDKQAAWYKSMANQNFVQDGATEVLVTNILARMTKLSQITQGFLQDGDQVTVIDDENPKLNALMDLIDGRSGPVVVVCRNLHEISMITERLAQAGVSHGVIEGKVSPEKRQQVVNDLNDGKIDVVIGQITTMGVGYNMTAASTMVFFSNTFSLIDRLQAEDRIHRKGQRNQCMYCDFIAMHRGKETINSTVVNSLQSKKDVVAMVSDMVNDKKISEINGLAGSVQ